MTPFQDWSKCDKDLRPRDFFLQDFFCKNFSPQPTLQAASRDGAPQLALLPRPPAGLLLSADASGPAVKPLRVPHVQQLFNWDCGLACVLMVLRAAAPRASAKLDLPDLRQWCSTTSIWTIDLAHLLRRFGVDVALTTITLGANEAFCSEEYYAENMASDEARVQQLFKDAPLAGIPVHERSLAAWEVQEALASGRYLAIALVDKTMLGGPWAWACVETTANVAYTGHYIVVVAYSAATDTYTVRDPAADVEDVTISSATFEAARRAFGTDEDLLLVGSPAPHGGIPAPGVDFARAASYATRL